MAKILSEGCVVACDHCTTKFSFDPSEVTHTKRSIPAGYSPEEEAYDRSVFSVGCPKCQRAVDVEGSLGTSAKREISARSSEVRMRSDHDL